MRRCATPWTPGTPARAGDERHAFNPFAQSTRSAGAFWRPNRGAWRRSRHRHGRKSRARRRIRLGQDRLGAGLAASAGRGATDRQCDVRRARTLHTERAPDARSARQRHRHDLSGADDRAQPAASGRAADCRGAGAARGAVPPRGLGAGRGVAGADGHRPARAACGGLSASALRRPEAAGNDCHGVGLPPPAAAGRRAHHRARRDRTPPDSRSARRLAGRIRPGLAVHHPRPSFGAALRAPRGRDAAGQGGGGRNGYLSIRRAAAPLYANAAAQPPAPPRAGVRKKCGAAAHRASGARAECALRPKQRFLAQTLAHRAAGRFAGIARRADLGRGGRIGQRQIDPRARTARPAAPTGRGGESAGTRSGPVVRCRAAPLARAGANRVPGPVFQPIAAAHRGADRRRGSGKPSS